MDEKIKFKEAFLKAVKNIKGSLPIMFSMLLLINLINVFGKDYYLKIFRGNLIQDSFIGAIAGSFSFGMPITSYIIGGELLKEGINLIAITAFIIAWTTVGLVMLPLEAKYLGKKFAISRNLVNFLFSILIAILTVITLKLFQ